MALRINLKNTDFPALYQAADNASNQVQKQLMMLSATNSIVLILGAITALLRSNSQCLAIISASLFLASLAITIHIKVANLQGHWYQSRALAESIKTSVWRLIMGADPYADILKSKNIEKFQYLLKELLFENKHITKVLSDPINDNEQITNAMLETIDASFEEKRELYLKDRIDNQRQWYSSKSGHNRKSSKNWFVALVLIYAVTIVMLLIQIAKPDITLLPIDVSAVVASSIIGWMQIKRYDELASAYGLTANEIGIIKSRYSSVTTEAELSAFVSDAENAFSREHTQWAARRDH
jgi:hypothetical protein